MKAQYTLGIDVSTQSISASLVDIGRGTVALAHSVSYRDDNRLSRFGIEPETFILPPREAGEAEQPPLMFAAALDALFTDLRHGGAPLQEVLAIAVSAQQHGHVYLNDRAPEAIAGLHETGAGRHGAGGDRSAPGNRRASPDHNAPPASASASARAPGNLAAVPDDLVSRLTGIFAYPAAPIWQTAHTEAEAATIRERAGGSLSMIEHSGSDSPLRFTGAVIRHTALHHPGVYESTWRIQLLSTFISALLSGNPETATDWGNGSGMSLMDYRKREWSDTLLGATARDLPGGAEVLRRKLPTLAPPTAPAGRIARYFSDRYGFSPECLVTIGSGDNPQSKVLVDSDLLSLGSSFVYMVDTGEPRVDVQGYANSMYDGVGRPFVFACRTNGALVWDRVLTAYGADFAAADATLAAVRPGSSVEIWQPRPESYPLSPVIPNGPVERGECAFPEAYAGIVDSSLAMVRHFSRGFDRDDSDDEESRPMAVTGGPSASRPVLERIAAIWNRPVYTVGSAGAALGAALSAWAAYAEASGRPADLEALRERVVARGPLIEPDRKSAERVSEGSSFSRNLLALLKRLQ